MRGASLAALLAVVCLGCLTPMPEQSATERELLRRIETSGTPQDHEALAAFYREEAKIMEERAASHDDRAKRYLRIPRGGRPGYYQQRGLAAYYRRIAAKYRELAALHERQASELRSAR